MSVFDLDAIALNTTFSAFSLGHARIAHHGPHQRHFQYLILL